MITAAGVLFQTADGRVLLVQRSGQGDHEGDWTIPGGKQEGDETAEQTARREVREELGIDLRSLGEGVALTHHTRRQKDGVDFTTFRCRIEQPFDPTLNDEHTKFVWTMPDAPPGPLHPGMGIVLARLGMDELGIARAIRDGELTSPQRYENISLFDLRITGTGAAYRQGLNEHVWREPGIYLNDEFLARCNGLPVIVEHPERNALNSDEYKNRNVGSILLPYIRGDEVWGVAKIYDDAAVRMLETLRLSTSPAVVFRDPDSTSKVPMGDGSTLLLEGKPTLLDHLAICEQGVWDKGGEPAGVKSTLDHGGSKVPDNDDTNPKPEATGSDAKLDAILGRMDALCSRMDAFEKGSAAPPFEKKDGEAMKTDADADGEMPSGETAEVAEGDAYSDGDNGDQMPSEISSMPEHTAADRVRKDSAVRGFLVERARRDAEASIRQAEEAQMRADAADTRRRLHELEKRIPTRVPTPADRAALADAQARADAVHAAFGDSAPRPLDGENLTDYRRRLVTGLKQHSPSWKDVNLAGLGDDVVTVAERQVYADAMTAARSPLGVPEGELRPIRTRDTTGREITTFVGSPSTWMSNFAAPRRRLAGIRNSGVR